MQEEKKKLWMLAAWLKEWVDEWMTINGYFKTWSMQRAFQTSGSQVWLHIRVTWRALKILVVQGVPLHHENQNFRGWYQHQYYKFPRWSSFLHQCFPTSTLVTVRARSSSVVGAILWVSGCFTASLAWPTGSQQHIPIVTSKNVPRHCQCPFRGAQLPPVKNHKSRLSLKLSCFQGPVRSHIESSKTARWGQSPGEIQPRASPPDWGWN